MARFYLADEVSEKACLAVPAPPTPRMEIVVWLPIQYFIHTPTRNNGSASPAKSKAVLHGLDAVKLRPGLA